MTAIGKFTKQPVAVEVYSIQYIDDLETGDFLTGTWGMLYRSTAPVWDGVMQTGTYAAQLTDAERIIVTSYSVTLPSGVSDGFRIYVSNQSQTSEISVGSFNVMPRGAAVIASLGGAWFVEASTNAVLIDSLLDQRVRTWVTGGSNLVSYKCQVIASTNTGRVLPDDFIVKVKEQ